MLHITVEQKQLSFLQTSGRPRALFTAEKIYACQSTYQTVWQYTFSIVTIQLDGNHVNRRIILTLGIWHRFRRKPMSIDPPAQRPTGGLVVFPIIMHQVRKNTANQHFRFLRHFVLFLAVLKPKSELRYKEIRWKSL